MDIPTILVIFMFLYFTLLIDIAYHYILPYWWYKHQGRVWLKVVNIVVDVNLDLTSEFTVRREHFTKGCIFGRKRRLSRNLQLELFSKIYLT